MQEIYVVLEDHGCNFELLSCKVIGAYQTKKDALECALSMETRTDRSFYQYRVEKTLLKVGALEDPSKGGVVGSSLNFTRPSLLSDINLDVVTNGKVVD